MLLDFVDPSVAYREARLDPARAAQLDAHRRGVPNQYNPLSSEAITFSRLSTGIAPQGLSSAFQWTAIEQSPAIHIAIHCITSFAAIGASSRWMPDRSALRPRCRCQPSNTTPRATVISRSAV